LSPLIPYVEVPQLPLSIKPFGTLVAFGVYLGSVVAMRHGRQRGIEEKKLSEFIFWVVGLGFVGGHMLDAIFYHPHVLYEPNAGLRAAFHWLGSNVSPSLDLASAHPHLVAPLYLVMLWDGLSSYGGFIGALLGALAFRWRRREKVLPMCEVINSAFPLAWVFGRMGCSSVHDHPGNLSDAWYAVRWPTWAPPMGPRLLTGDYYGRLDLGLIEMVLTIPLAVAFLVLWHRKPVRPLGFYTGWMCVAYAPVRFLLDFLREPETTGGDLRYGGLTPAQWACFGLLALGLWFLRYAHIHRDDPQPVAASAPEAPEAPGDEEEARSSTETSSTEAPASEPPRRGTASRRKRRARPEP
jgi:phosphatidylglycerol---prolipoprotein diacylglyceryl transferase